MGKADSSEIYCVKNTYYIQRVNADGSLTQIGVVNGTSSDLRLKIANGSLYALGSFTTVSDGNNANPVSADGVAKWTGTVWQALPGNPQFTSTSYSGNASEIIDIAVNASGRIMLCGAIDTINGGAATSVAYYNGTSWSNAGTSTSTGSQGWIARVGLLETTASGDFIANGPFVSIGGVTTTHGLARYNGTSWTNIAGPGTLTFTNSIYPGLLVVDQSDGKIYFGCTTSTGGNQLKLCVVNTDLTTQDMNWPIENNGFLTVSSYFVPNFFSSGVHLISAYGKLYKNSGTNWTLFTSAGFGLTSQPRGLVKFTSGALSGKLLSPFIETTSAGKTNVLRNGICVYTQQASPTAPDQTITLNEDSSYSGLAPWAGCELRRHPELHCSVGPVKRICHLPKFSAPQQDAFVFTERERVRYRYHCLHCI
ncbi:MAG: hypothetical protein QM757_44035 [Paludibaculum sp.]